MPPEMRSSPVSSVSSACAGAAASAAIVRAVMAPQPVILMEFDFLSLWRGHPGRLVPRAGERQKGNGLPKARKTARQAALPGDPPAMADDEPGGRSPGSRVIDFVPSSRDASPEGPSQPVTYWNGASPLTVAGAARE